ncbi:MAG: peptidoglycan DD-metalloendopeptidase family protein [Candidatus Sedimenticola sp. PURPLELP]
MMAGVRTRCGSLLVIAAVLLAGTSFTSSAAKVEQEIQGKEQELHQIRRNIKDLKSELTTQQRQREALESELREAEQEIGRSARRLRVLAGSLQRQQKRLGSLEEVRGMQQAELVAQRNELAVQMRTAYAMGRQERLKILLNQQDPSVVSRVMVYYDYFNRARAARIAAINQTLDAIHETEREITSEETRLMELQGKELAENRKLEASNAARREIVTALNARIKSKGQELKGLELNERQLKTLVSRLNDEYMALPLEGEKAKPFNKRKGRLRWPTKGRLKARFGTTKAGSLKWDGVLISAPEGREIKAVHHGRVAFADWLRGFGLLIIIDHGDGYMSLYGHNQSLFKETGEWVEPGEAVALVGNSGGQQNSGVYFGIRHNGKPVNPIKWCTRSKGNRVGAVADERNNGLAALRLPRQREDRV